MPDNINNVMITNTTRNNTTVSNIIFFVGDNVISQGISFTCSSGCFLYNLRGPYLLYVCELDAWIC